jgi:hypothetical protein
LTYVLNRSYGSWSAGTVVDVMGTPLEERKKWEKPGDTIDHGYATVRTRSPQRNGNHITFDIPVDYLTKRRSFYIDR